MTSPQVFVMKYLYEGNSKNDVYCSRFRVNCRAQQHHHFGSWMVVAGKWHGVPLKKCRSYLIFGGISGPPVLYRHSDFASCDPMQRMNEAE
jgi:hypothetical protein